MLKRMTEKMTDMKNKLFGMMAMRKIKKKVKKLKKKISG